MSSFSYPPKIQITETDQGIIISDKMPFAWQSILVAAVVSCGLGWVLTGGVVGLIYGVIFTAGYSTFRWLASQLFQEIVISEGHISRRSRFGNRVRSEAVIDKNFSAEKLQLREIPRRGKQFYMLTYETHQTLDLILVQNQTDIQSLKNLLS